MIGPLRRLASIIGAFRRDNAGNMAIIFAFASIPVIGAVGAAIDFGNAYLVRGQLQDAADAAAIGSIVRSSPAYAIAASMTSDGPIPTGTKDAIGIFNANFPSKGAFTLSSFSASVAVSHGVLTSTAQFAAVAPTYFLGLFGIKSIPLSGSSAARDNMPLYVDFYLLLDNSPSMGVGATQNDITTMVNNTSDKCAFACHDLNDNNNYYNLAKKLGVTMRIDVLRSATQQLMDTASALETVPNEFRVAIYTLGSSASTAGLTAISPLTLNLSNAKVAAGGIDLLTVNGQNQNNDQDTNYDSILSALNNQIFAPGAGTSPSSPQKIVFFVTDGVADENNPGSCSQPTTNGRCQEPINLALCTALKNRGIKIALLYTTYLPLPTNAWYNTWIAPFVNNIGPTMQSCASPDLYFEVSPTQGISQAMNALFLKAVADIRITQ